MCLLHEFALTVLPMCVPPAARRRSSVTSTRRAAHATRPPSSASAGGERAPCGPCVCRCRRVAIAAGRARAVPPARPSDATAPPSWRWRRGRAARPMCVPPPAHRGRGGTSTRCAFLAMRLPLSACADGGQAVRLFVCFSKHFALDLDPPPPRGAALARRSQSRLARPHARACALHAACLSSDPANSAAACSDCASCRRIPVILAPRSPDARRVLARRTGLPQRPAAVRRAGPFRFRKEHFDTEIAL